MPFSKYSPYLQITRGQLQLAIAQYYCSQYRSKWCFWGFSNLLRIGGGLRCFWPAYFKIFLYKWEGLRCSLRKDLNHKSQKAQQITYLIHLGVWRLLSFDFRTSSRSDAARFQSARAQTFHIRLNFQFLVTFPLFSEVFVSYFCYFRGCIWMMGLRWMHRLNLLGAAPKTKTKNQSRPITTYGIWSH